MGFFAAATHRLAPLLATILPALIILGIFIFARLVETNVEDVVYLRRIDTIRRYYATLDPAAAIFFPSVAAALPSTEMRAGIAELSFTSASMIAAVTSILAGAGAAFLLDAVGVPLAAAFTVGVAATLLVYGLHMLWMYRRRRPATA